MAIKGDDEIAGGDAKVEKGSGGGGDEIAQRDVGWIDVGMDHHL